MAERQLSADPEQIREFVTSLKGFNDFTNDTYDSTMAALSRLLESWEGPGAELFRDRLVHSAQCLLSFQDQSLKLMQRLTAEAERLEDIVRIQQVGA